MRSIRWKIIMLAATGAILLAGNAQAAPRLTTRIAEHQVALWRCQDQLGTKRTQAGQDPWSLPRSTAYRAWVLNLWTVRHDRCIARLHARAAAIRKGQINRLTNTDLYAVAADEIRKGGIYSHRWGDASPLLKSLCYEALNRAFGVNAGWARYVVNRESGCNPGAINTTYAACLSWSTCQRATGLSQMIPAIHRWVDYDRALRDLRYSVQVFVRLSDRGRSTGPWSTY